MSTKRELDKLIRDYRQRGWTVVQTNSCHWKWKPPGGGEFVITSGSPGNMRAIINIQADLRRCERSGGRQ